MLAKMWLMNCNFFLMDSLNVGLVKVPRSAVNSTVSCPWILERERDRE